MIHDSFAANEGPGLPNAADKYEAPGVQAERLRHTGTVERSICAEGELCAALHVFQPTNRLRRVDACRSWDREAGLLGVRLRGRLH